jgi:hypothetical protein
MSKTKLKQNPLRQTRIAQRLSLQDVGRHYRDGVTRERIRQIESSPIVRTETAEAYLEAVGAAARERDHLDVIRKRVVAEVNAESSR